MGEVLEFIAIGDKEYRVIKTGRAQAEQVAHLTRWLSVHGARAIARVQEDATLLGESLSGVESFVRFLGVLDADAIIDLFIVLTGCTKEEAEVYFDIAILVDVAIEVYNRQTSLRRLLDRFFSQSNSGSTSEEPSTSSE